MGATLFISDLHLTGERPEVIGLFSRFLKERARHAEALYILGDLFEAWLGDDLLLPGYPPVLEAIRETTAAGIPVYIMHGNRDFLLGGEFERETGCRLIDDPTLLELAGTPTLLMHGDTLCVDDLAYQELRRTLRDPAWVDGFLGRAPEERIALARELRDKSQEAVGSKDYAIMDVNPGAVEEAFRRHGAARLIHGHTHRPACHQSTIDGNPVTRWVLGDWSDHAEVLCCDAHGCRLERFA